ncbi:HlyD family type I secretion periplasmic adaptor subunit [Marinicauda salina]|uniref:Membrane fusion protein (MFP) family protein n=1 Tax=Marinicauda salina TaxID=2135793 RepID=A0A2U2BX52_9PROT|nr:HlyD family type I secretion periplasmic adaptor subunit [Marinicauda salina]PWE18601.1 HlyD family type I secretion periplasmic adaptor subunit [Marinicauda salina]
MTEERTDESATPAGEAGAAAAEDDFFDVMQPREGRWVILALLGALIFFLLWAGLTKLDEVTRAEGRVIPSRNTQSIQSSEPGTIREMLVRVGEQVEEGQVLVRLDDTLSSSDLGELESRLRALRAQQARLRVEASGGTLEDFLCPEEVAAADPEVCASERSLLEARLAAIRDRREIVEQRLEQRRRQLNEARTNIRTHREALALAEERLELVRPMAQTNVLPQTDLIEAERVASEQRGLLSASREAAQGAEAAVREAEAQLSEITTGFREEVQTTLNEVNDEINVIRETLRGAEDRVSRAEIRSPVSGTVNAIGITTLGAYVAPGQEILSVVPRDDTLLVEARVAPSDIAFIRPDQDANVKITAYDFTIYGGLDAEVTYVSSDSVYNSERDETYFVVHLQTDRAFLEMRGEQFPISPGMITQAEIVTGRKSILDYLLKPVTRAWGEALRER